MAGGIMVGGRFLWNIDAHVGPGCPNKIEDYQLVQLGYASMGSNPNAHITAEQRKIYSAVNPGATYTGGADDPLTIAIATHEKGRGGAQDGRVSPISNATGRYGAIAFIMVALCNNIADVMGSAWPNLDKHPKCPKALADRSNFVLAVPKPPS